MPKEDARIIRDEKGWWAAVDNKEEGPFSTNVKARIALGAMLKAGREEDEV